MSSVRSTTYDKSLRRVIVLIVDGCGVGAAPDAADFGDSADCNTLGNIGRQVDNLELPNFQKLGLGNICNISGVPVTDKAQGFFGKLRERSQGKDTQTGHWELMGVESQHAFPTYPEGFPKEVVDKFIAQTGCLSILCNRPASGTEILERLGAEHIKTRYPIVYTSGDSVFQIACHVEVVPLPKLYKWCEIARQILIGKHRVGRVIARPFEGIEGNYKRLQGDRRDYAVPPPENTLLDDLSTQRIGVLGIGKIEDIFTGRGLSHAKHTASNAEGLKWTLEAIRNQVDWQALALNRDGLSNCHMIFTNLVDTDSLFGHRRDVKGYAQALVEIDQWLGMIINDLRHEDLLIITSDHGNDPTAPGTDHTREYVPLLLYSAELVQDLTISATGLRDLGIRSSFADVGATIALWLGLPWSHAGASCLRQDSAVGIS